MAGKTSAFDELIAKLKAVTDTLKGAAEQMRRTAELRAANTAKLQALNERLRALLPDLKRQNEALDAAGDRLRRAALQAPPLPAARPQPLEPVRPTPRKIDFFPIPPPKRGSQPN